jgi:hypothetical protein
MLDTEQKHLYFDAFNPLPSGLLLERNRDLRAFASSQRCFASLRVPSSLKLAFCVFFFWYFNSHLLILGVDQASFPAAGRLEFPTIHIYQQRMCTTTHRFDSQYITRTEGPI